ncbi:portal vertex protein [uncultured Caudovirales phage]|uniref:Portal vertex protein n=1 Tax=uncultured Caudovirales phage TaxID=2100421 RepID=A0A6J5LU05_9CAUD|nr:portal vertex protein [uncultured Caudovirales phage]
MSWKKYFKVADTSGSLSPISGRNQFGLQGYTRQGEGDYNVHNEFAFRNYASRLPEVYSGHPNRIERYNQYENMDCDSEINACLDIISEFSTQLNNDNRTPFDIDFTDQPTDHEVEIIKKQLQQWTKLNKLDQRIFKIFRNSIKYGDQIFVRDPETFEMYWVDMSKVVRIIVNESEGKRPEQYVVRDINPNFQNLTVAAKTTNDYAVNPTVGSVTAAGGYSAPSSQNGGAVNSGSRFQTGMNETCIDAKHVVHLSLSEGLDTFWPFGQSILENIFKVYKQKELLEDAVLIYRVSRAPERRVFKIDVGNMPSHMAMAFVERVKNEMHQRRIPTVGGGGSNMMDATYNPLSINEDYFFPQTAEGRGSSVDTLAGGSNLGEIDDLKYFNNKMARGLRVPSSYLPTGPDDSDRTTNDGRVGTALIQEFRFNQYCERLQNLIMQKLDDEFKMFMRWRGFNIDSGLFNIKFTAPQNFASYREAELDTSRVNTFTALEPLPYLSKRFLLERYLGLSKEEIVENEKMWREERDQPELQTTQGQDLRAIGITPAGLESDIQTGEELAGMGAPGVEPAPGATPAPGAAPAAPATAPPGAPPIPSI